MHILSLHFDHVLSSGHRTFPEGQASSKTLLPASYHAYLVVVLPEGRHPVSRDDTVLRLSGEYIPSGQQPGSLRSLEGRG